MVPVTELDATRGDTFHRFPRFLPDGVHFLFLVISSKPESRRHYLGSLASKETHRLVDALNKPEFAPPDLLLFVRESTLMAQRLDTNSSRTIGAPFRVVEPVSSNTTTVQRRSLCRTTACWRTEPGVGGDVRELVWVDRNGKRGGTVGAAAGYQNPRLSPNGQRLAVFKPEGGGDIWVTELETGISTRFTLDPAFDNVPLWSRDGTRIAFVSNRSGGVFNIYQKNAGGTAPEELLLKTPRHKQLNDWSRDDRYLVYEEDDPQTKTDLWVLPLAGIGSRRGSSRPRSTRAKRRYLRTVTGSPTHQTKVALGRCTCRSSRLRTGSGTCPQGESVRTPTWEPAGG